MRSKETKKLSVKELEEMRRQRALDVAQEEVEDKVRRSTRFRERIALGVRRLTNEIRAYTPEELGLDDVEMAGA